MKSPISALAVVLAVAAAPALAQLAAKAAVNPPDEFEPRTYEFHVDWGPLQLAEVKFRYEETDGRIELKGSGESVGLGAMIADFEAQQRVVYEDDVRLYESEGRWKNDSARRVVSWRDGEPTVEVDEDTRDYPDELTPIPEGELADTVDPAFPVIDVLKRVSEGGRCEGAYRVYDGVRRFDIEIVDEGRQHLVKDRRWTYEGYAKRCSMRFTRVGGFKVDSKWKTEESDMERLVWIAEVDDVHVPVRLSVSWPLGYATGRIDLR